jgi:hypothetical protein
MEKTKFLKNCRNNHLAKSFIINLFNLKNLNKILFIFIIILGISYLAGANDLAIKGYALSDLKEQSGKLADENKKLELRAMDLSSYSAVSEKINNLKMVAVGNIDYLNGKIESVAKR